MIVYDVQHLTKLYPGQTQPANQDISLTIEQGEIFGLLGDNGAGKTTLVRQMVGLAKSSAGRITLLGQDILANPLCVSTHVGYMPQDATVLNSLTVQEAVYYTAHLRGFSRAAARAESAMLLEQWGLAALAQRPIMRLSSGQKRLVQLAVTLAGAPEVLILDEPTNALDPQRRKLVWEALRALNRERGTTILFITHDAIEAEKIIQRVGIMRGGRLVALGRPSDLKQAVDRKLRLELFFSPETPPALPAHLPCDRLEAGRWRALLEWGEVNAVLQTLNLDELDDFRLYSATLEDLYLHYAEQA